MCPSICLWALSCLNRLTFDLDFWHKGGSWPWLAWDCRSRSLVKGQGQTVKIVYILPFEPVVQSRSILGLGLLSSANGNPEWPLQVHWNCLFVGNQGAFHVSRISSRSFLIFRDNDIWVLQHINVRKIMGRQTYWLTYEYQTVALCLMLSKQPAWRHHNYYCFITITVFLHYLPLIKWLKLTSHTDSKNGTQLDDVLYFATKLVTKLSYYRQRSRGDNTFGSVRVCVCPSVFLFEPFDIDFWHEDRPWPWLAWYCRSRSNSENCLHSTVWTSGGEQVNIRTWLAEFSQW